MPHRSVAYHQLLVLPAYTHAQSPAIVAYCLNLESIIPHTALLNGLHYVDQYRYLAPATEA